MLKRKPYKIKKALVLLILCWQANNAMAFNDAGSAGYFDDSTRSSTLKDAIQYLRKLPPLDSSALWPNVSPNYFLENLNLYIQNPLYTFESKNTSFCGYTALSFVTLDRDPLGFVKFMLQLYQKGKAQMGRAVFEPSLSVRIMAGKLKYKGVLDINPATQMWFLTLADHFKGYLNTFNKRYDQGDENTMWAATNFAKFNRMLRRLFNWKVRGRGADLIRPNISDLYTYLREKLQTGTVFLYLNNRLLYKKKHVVARVGVPTHYVVLLNISKEDDKINIAYMDGGRKTFQQISPELLHKIVFGVSHCTTR